jgi:hypothetical protein
MIDVHMSRPATMLREAMRAKPCAVFAVVVLTAYSWTQAVLKPIYVASFRKGPTRISEHSLVANLNLQNSYYKATVKDADGNDRYQLTLEPQRIGDGDETIISWRVQLIDPHRRYLGNLLVATKPTELLSDRPQDRAWWLDPSPYAVVPLLAPRVFKVENFYFVVQVKDYHLLVPEGRPLDSMRVELQFTGTEPQHD